MLVTQVQVHKHTPASRHSLSDDTNDNFAYLPVLVVVVVVVVVVVTGLSMTGGFVGIAVVCWAWEQSKKSN